MAIFSQLPKSKTLGPCRLLTPFLDCHVWSLLKSIRGSQNTLAYPQHLSCSDIIAGSLFCPLPHHEQLVGRRNGVMSLITLIWLLASLAVTRSRNAHWVTSHLQLLHENPNSKASPESCSQCPVLYYPDLPFSNNLSIILSMKNT